MFKTDLTLILLSSQTESLQWAILQLESRRFIEIILKTFRDFSTKSTKAIIKFIICEAKNKYSSKGFENVSREFIFDDHNPPLFTLMKAFGSDLEDWFKEDDKNVAAIHCKAGKGRTGVMIGAYLLYSGKFTKAKDALDFYAIARTYNGKGVTIPSQIRYIYYFEQSLCQGWNENKVVLKLNKIRMLTIPQVSSGGCKPLFVIKNDHKDKKSKHFTSSDEIKTNFIKGK